MLLKSLDFYEDFVTFDPLDIVKQTKRVFDGGYREEVIKTKVYKKKIDKLRKHWWY